MQRIDSIVYQPAATAEGQETTLFLTGPAEFLCYEIAEHLKADPVWAVVFADNIDSYKRMDYSIRSLPALRVYNNTYTKEFESWFLNGEIICDLIFPANIRRRETQQLPDSLTAALMQQFRRPTFFEAMCEKVPGLNELGKRFDVDKSLAFEWEDEIIPLTQMTVNFRIDLRQWDNYLEFDNRTKADPFIRTLDDLERMVTSIRVNEDEGIEIDVDQDLT